MPDSITPHGSEKLLPLYITDDSARKAAISEAETLPSVTVSSATAANAVMLGAGYFTPLSGFMDTANALSVGESMTLESGLFWPTPVMNLLEAEPFTVPAIGNTPASRHSCHRGTRLLPDRLKFSTTVTSVLTFLTPFVQQ